MRLHHSRDLVRWEPVGPRGGALDETRLLELAGTQDSAGVWAPSLSYADGLFHLLYSNVSAYVGGFSDCPNYLVTAPSIEGPWSDPVLLNARGFDASLFHDGGQSWMVNIEHDWRPGHRGSLGLEATRYDRGTRRLTGAPERITLPKQAAWIEGPNLYRIGDWYYLITADGGTSWEHQVTVSRSRSLFGPYERDPQGPLITARDHPELTLQKAGHGSLVEAGEGEWYLAYLAARPYGVHGECILGRETALAPVEWTEDGWPWVPGGLPAETLPAPRFAAARFAAARFAAAVDGAPEPEPSTPFADQDTVPVQDTDDFDGPVLGPHWSTLRRPASFDWLSLAERPSHLRVRGGRSPRSLHGVSLVARRVDAPDCGFEAALDYEPRAIQHLAGITAYYNTENWYFLHVTVDDEGRRVLRVAGSDRGVVSNDELGQVLLGEAPSGPVRLGVDLADANLTFRYDTGGGWRPIGAAGGYDATVLSDEHARLSVDGQVRAMGFTGAFFGLWAWDLTGSGHSVDFASASLLRSSNTSVCWSKES